MPTGLIFYQLFDAESSTYTYLLADAATRQAVLIDPVLEKIERDLQLINELGVSLKFVLDTHVHADHITASGQIRSRTGCLSAVGAGTEVRCADRLLNEADVLEFGVHKLRVLSTPGHTAGCCSYVVGDLVFTGDALLIRGTGRTDFQEGSASQLYHSVTHKLFALPDETLVYPGHDYKGQTHSTIGLEKKFNPRLGGGRTREQFVQTMSELKLADPKRMHEAVPANKECGQTEKGI